MPETPPIHWNAEALWEELVRLLPGISLEIVPRIGSTNTALLERARAVPESRPVPETEILIRRSVESSAFGRRSIDLAPCLMVAEQQTAGRGRQGRSWQSAPGASLTFSLRLPVTTRSWSGLSLAVGVALANALDPGDPETPGQHVGLKWPNDLWLMDGPLSELPFGRKLGGILIETVAAGGDTGPDTRLVVVGVGLNVKAFEAGEARSGFASLSEMDATATAPSTLARIARPLVEALQAFERAGFDAFASAFETRDLLRGRSVQTTAPQAFEGTACGVSSDGSLCLDTTAGRMAVSSGEVSVRLAPGAAC